MSHVLLVFDPDETCVDPGDSAAAPRRHVEVLEGDVVVIWRERIDPDSPDGITRTHLWGDGIFENVTIKELRRALKKMGVSP